MIRYGGVSDQTWIIPGGTGGIGQAVANAVVERMKDDDTRKKVIITSRSAEKAAEIARSIDPDRVIGLPLDTTCPSSLESFWRSIEHHRPTRFAYCAGGVQSEAKTPEGGSILKIPPEAFLKQFSVTLFGAVNAQNIIGQGMIDQNLDDEGKLMRRLVFVHTSSASSIHPLPRVGPYSAAMRGIDSLIESWQRELAAQYGPNLAVHGVRPGFVPTDQNRGLLLDSTAADGLTARGRTVSASAIVQRMGRTSEISPAYLFLASDEAAFMAGTIINVCGGYLHRSLL